MFSTFDAMRWEMKYVRSNNVVGPVKVNVTFKYVICNVLGIVFSFIKLTENNAICVSYVLKFFIMIIDF